MAGKPYMQFFISNYIRDTRRLTLEARGAYQDLQCYLWSEKQQGVITGDITDMALLLGVDANKTKVVLDEIFNKNLLECEVLENGRLRITDPVMVANTLRSATKAAAGKKGMAQRYKKENSVTDSVITDVITKGQQKPNNNINSNDKSNSKEEEGGTGEETNPAHTDATGDCLAHPQRQFPATLNSMLSKEDCLNAYFTEVCEQQRHLHLLNRPQLQNDEAALRRWGEAFNLHLINKGENNKLLRDWCSHFFNWTKTQDLTRNPKDIFKNEPNSKQQSRAAAGGANSATAILPQGDRAFGKL